MAVYGPEAPVQCLACKDVVEHLAAAVMEDAPPAIRGQRAVEHDKRALSQQRIAGVLFRPDDEVERYFVVLGVEVAGNGNQR